jgi:hypothetical protein
MEPTNALDRKGWNDLLSLHALSLPWKKE